MADGAVKHDFHLVKPSPWPVLGALAMLAVLERGHAVPWVGGLFRAENEARTVDNAARIRNPAGQVPPRLPATR